jgi:hypothetical protein
LTRRFERLKTMTEQKNQLASLFAAMIGGGMPIIVSYL